MRKIIGITGSVCTVLDLESYKVTKYSKRSIRSLIKLGETVLGVEIQDGRYKYTELEGELPERFNNISKDMRCALLSLQMRGLNVNEDSVYTSIKQS